MPGALPRVRVLVGDAVNAPVVTVAGESVPPPDCNVQGDRERFAAAFPSSPVAVTVTVAVEPGAPLGWIYPNLRGFRRFVSLTRVP